MAQALAAGCCLLLFDGLDEIADLGARQLLIQSIQAFLNHPQHPYRENLCLVTSRPHGYHSISLGAGFQESEVKPFEPEDVKLFITLDSVSACSRLETRQTVHQDLAQHATKLLPIFIADRMYHYPSSKMWSTIFGTLLYQGTEAMVESLLIALNSSEWIVRISAAQALGTLGRKNEEVVNVLLQSIKDPKNMYVQERLLL